MLSEEEKKAIEILKNFNDGFTFKECEVCFNYNEQDCCCNKEKCDNLKATDTLLNLITKLQKENEHWKNKFEKELEDNRKNSCELLKQDLVIREKDKQIDLMAEVIFKRFTAQLVIEYGIENKKQFIKLFENKVKEIGE